MKLFEIKYKLWKIVGKSIKNFNVVVMFLWKIFSEKFMWNKGN